METQVETHLEWFQNSEARIDANKDRKAIGKQDGRSTKR